MSVTITNLEALRTAMHIRAKDEYQAAFRWIKLEAPNEGERGRMIATDGYSLLISEEAHDSMETRYWRPTATWKVPKNATEVVLRDDSALIQTSRKTDLKPIEWANDGDTFTWPDVERVLPAEDAEVVPLSGPVDSIKGGKIAEAYGLQHGAWIPMPGGKLAKLWNTKDTDLIILVPLRNIEGWIV